MRVLIVSPIPALRAGLSALLSGDPELEVAAESSLAELETPLQAGGAPAVIIATPGGVDLETLGPQPGLALLLVTGEAQDIQALSGLELRAWGVISPDATAEALQAAVRALGEGLAVVSPELLRQALPEMEAGPGVGDEDEEPLDPLTERENDVLLRLAQGLTNKQIALALGISEHTVKFHVSSIYTKLGVSNRTEALRKGAKRGWVPL